MNEQFGIDDSGITRIGWWEWVHVHSLPIDPLRAKTDTGAKGSSLHATNLVYTTTNEQPTVTFTTTNGTFDRPLQGMRYITSSTGHTTIRPVIWLTITVAEVTLDIDCTLSDRTSLTFPMLLGRRALAHRFVIDPSRKRTHPRQGVRS